MFEGSIYSCSFDVDICGMVHDRNDDFNWTRNSGSTLSADTGPQSDHTNGKGI